MCNVCMCVHVWCVSVHTRVQACLWYVYVCVYTCIHANVCSVKSSVYGLLETLTIVTFLNWLCDWNKTNKTISMFEVLLLS